MTRWFVNNESMNSSVNYYSNDTININNWDRNQELHDATDIGRGYYGESIKY